MVALVGDTHLEPFLKVFSHSLACWATFLQFLLEWSSVGPEIKDIWSEIPEIGAS